VVGEYGGINTMTTMNETQFKAHQLLPESPDIIKTIESSDKNQFNRYLKQQLDNGWHLEKKSNIKFDGKIFSQSIVLNKSNYNYIEYWSDLKYFTIHNEKIKILGNYTGNSSDFNPNDPQTPREYWLRSRQWYYRRKDGKWTHYNMNGSLLLVRNYKDGVRSGEFIQFHDNGQIWIENNYINGKEDGKYVEYRDNGNIWSEGNFKDGMRVGKWCGYNEDGSIESSHEY